MNITIGYYGCFPLCQRFRKFRSDVKWKGPFRFLPTGIFGITFGGGPLISVGTKFSFQFWTNHSIALILFPLLCAYSESSPNNSQLAERTRRILCACSENLIRSEVAILGADLKERDLWDENASLQVLSI